MLLDVMHCPGSIVMLVPNMKYCHVVYWLFLLLCYIYIYSVCLVEVQCEIGKS